jgi:hypothetical protein
MSASVFEVARPTLGLRGLLGLAEPILITGERAAAKARGGISWLAHTTLRRCSERLRCGSWHEPDCPACQSVCDACLPRLSPPAVSRSARIGYSVYSQELPVTMLVNITWDVQHYGAGGRGGGTIFQMHGAFS